MKDKTNMHRQVKWKGTWFAKEKKNSLKLRKKKPDYINTHKCRYYTKKDGLKHLTKRISIFVGRFNWHKSTHSNNNKICIKNKQTKRIDFLPTQYSTRKKRSCTNNIA